METILNHLIERICTIEILEHTPVEKNNMHLDHGISTFMRDFNLAKSAHLKINTTYERQNNLIQLLLELNYCIFLVMLFRFCLLYYRKR